MPPKPVTDMRAILESFVGMAGSDSWKGDDGIAVVDVVRDNGTDSVEDNPAVEEVFRDEVTFGREAELLGDEDSATAVEAFVEDGAAFVHGTEVFGAIDVLRAGVEFGTAAEGA